MSLENDFPTMPPALAASLEYTGFVASENAPECGAHKTLWAVSDLHAGSSQNRRIVEEHLHPVHPEDWLVVAGDVAENLNVVSEVLQLLASRYAKVIFAPGNHELFASAAESFKGRDRYTELVRRCRRLGVLTPEDPFPEFAGHTIAALFTLYDHSWRSGWLNEREALEEAAKQGVVFNDEYLIQPYTDVPTWCRERLEYSALRLGQIRGKSVLVNHWPLAIQKVHQLERFGLGIPGIGLWSGSVHTQQWASRYNASAVIHGHLHMPVALEVRGVPHIEVSLGYPKEWGSSLGARMGQGYWPFPVLRAPAASPQSPSEGM